MTNKKGIAKISTYLVALIIIGMVFTGMLGMMSIANQEAADFLTGSEEEDYASLNTTFGTFLDDAIDDNQEFQKGINGTQTDSGSFGFLDTLVNSGFSTFKNIFASYGAVSGVLGNIDTWGLGIPTWVGAGLLSIILLLIAFGIYRFIFKVDG